MRTVPSPSRNLQLPWQLLGLLVLAAACHDSRPRHEITEVREQGRVLKLGASSAERFGFSRTSSPHGGMGAAASSFADQLHYQLPEGWQKLPPRQFRDLNLRVGGEGEKGAECYLSKLVRGGVANNLNRWRGQMSLPDLSAEEIEALPKRQLLGREASYLEAKGSFGGMGGEARPDYMLLGFYTEFPAFAVSVKMVGPAAVVEAQKETFAAFCSSLHMDKMDAPAKGVTPSLGGREPISLLWEVPEGWKKGQGSDMRLVTFTVEDSDPAKKAECWIIPLSVGSGSVLDNINRWRGEMGLEPMDAAGLPLLPKLEVLGQESTLLEVEGSYRGMGGSRQEGACLLGVICSLPSVNIYIKMVGESQHVAAQKDHFVGFCKSLRRP